MEQKSFGAVALWVLVALVVGGILGYSVAGKSSANPSYQQGGEERELALKLAMRKLWADHVIWTRQYIAAAVAGAPDADEAAKRLLKNQEDIGGAIVAYYGAPAGAKLTDLLKQHILIAVDLLKAAKTNNTPKFNDANKRWHDNANNIATFLSGANPNWPKKALSDMLDEHLALTTQEAVARLGKKWSADVAAFDKIFEQAMMMADGLSEGIVKQFPSKF